MNELIWIEDDDGACDSVLFLAGEFRRFFGETRWTRKLDRES